MGPLYSFVSQFRIFVGSTTASNCMDKPFYTTVRYRNPKGIDIIDDFLPLTLTIQHDGPKQRGLMSSLRRMFVEFAAWYVPLRVLKIIC